MKKFVVCFIVSTLILVTCCGCCKKNEAALLNGSYKLSNYDGVYMSPIIDFDTKNNTFSFYYDFLSSYYAYGKITVSNDTVVAKTDDGKYSYVFKIKNNTTIVFVQNGSSEIYITDKNAPQITNGTEFVFWGK